jgi:dephospho-CoA kinase
MQRDQLTEEQIVLRMQRQMTDEEKRPYCKYVIINDDEHLLIEQVEQLMNVLSGKA